MHTSTLFSILNIELLVGQVVVHRYAIFLCSLDDNLVGQLTKQVVKMTVTMTTTKTFSMTANSIATIMTMTTSMVEDIHLEELMVNVVELRVGGSATVVEIIQITNNTTMTTSLEISTRIV